MVNQPDLPVEQRIEKIHERFGDVSMSLVIDHRDQWVVGIHFGQEADDSPMFGGAAYGFDRRLRNALLEALERVGV